MNAGQYHMQEIKVHFLSIMNNGTCYVIFLYICLHKNLLRHSERFTPKLVEVKLEHILFPLPMSLGTKILILLLGLAIAHAWKLNSVSIVNTPLQSALEEKC